MPLQASFQLIQTLKNPCALSWSANQIKGPELLYNAFSTMHKMIISSLNSCYAISSVFPLTESVKLFHKMCLSGSDMYRGHIYDVLYTELCCKTLDDGII